MVQNALPGAALKGRAQRVLWSQGGEAWTCRLDGCRRRAGGQGAGQGAV